MTQNSYKKFMSYIEQKSHTEQNLSRPNRTYSELETYTEVPPYFVQRLNNEFKY